MPADDILAGLCVDVVMDVLIYGNLHPCPELSCTEESEWALYCDLSPWQSDYITNSVISMSAAQTFGTLHSLIILYRALLYTVHLLLK